MKREEEIKCPRLQKTYMSKLNENDDSHPQNREYDAIVDFKGLRVERSCTEIYFTYIFIILNVLIIALAAFVLKDLNFNRLLYGQDFRGDYCGIKTLEKEKFVYWPDPVGWGIHVKACVEKCPVTNNEERCLYNEFNTEYVEDYCLKTYPTKDVKGYCIPTDNIIYREIIDSQIHSWANFFINAAIDLLLLSPMIAIALAASVGLAIINSILLNISKFNINKVWFFFSFLFMIVECAGCAYLFYTDLGNLKSKECSDSIATNCAEDRQNFLYMMIGICGLMALYSLFKLLFNFPNIFFNFTCQTYLGGPIKRVFIFFVPLVFSFIQIAVICVTMVLFVLFMTSGYNVNVTAGTEFYMPEVRKTLMTWYAYYGSFLLFALMYLYLSFFISVQRTMIATLVAQWYFSKTRMWLKGSLCKGYRSVCKHIGTLFYHGFIIAIIWPFRSLMAFVMSRFNKIKYANGCHMCMIKCCTLFVRLYRDRLRWTYSQALYQTVIFGDTFKIAGIKLYFLRYRNYGRYKGFEGKFGFFSYYSTMLVSFTASMVLYYFVQFMASSSSLITYDMTRLQFPQMAPLICFVFSAAICRGYNNLIDYGFEVMVMCFMADEEMFTGDQVFADHKTTDFFNNLGTQAEKAFMKDIQSAVQEHRGAKEVILSKKKKKYGKVKKEDDEEAGENSSEDSEDLEEQKKARGAALQKMFEEKRKEKELMDEERKKEADEDGQKKKKIELKGDTVAGNLLKMAQRQAIATTSKEDKIKLLRKKSDDGD